MGKAAVLSAGHLRNQVFRTLLQVYRSSVASPPFNRNIGENLDAVAFGVIEVAGNPGAMTYRLLDRDFQAFESLVEGADVLHALYPERELLDDLCVSIASTN